MMHTLPEPAQHAIKKLMDDEDREIRESRGSIDTPTRTQNLR